MTASNHDDPLLVPAMTDDDLIEVRQRIPAAARAYQQLGGMLPDPIHMALALDIPHLLGEVERLRALLDDVRDHVGVHGDGAVDVWSLRELLAGRRVRL
jgi:hypothetical protein